jgi:hypothetical protein
VSVERRPPYRSFLTASIRDMDTQFKKLPLQLPAQYLFALTDAGSKRWLVVL